MKHLYTISLLIVFSCVAQSSVAQSLIGDSLNRLPAAKILRMANQSMKYNDWYSAIELLELYKAKRPKKLEAQYELGKLYLVIRQYQQAEYQLQKVTNIDSTRFPEAWFLRGQCLKSLEQYDEAAKCFAIFEGQYKSLNNRRLYKRLLAAETSIFPKIDSITNHPLPAQVKPLTNINHLASESGVFSVGPALLYYTALEDDAMPIIKMKDSLPDVPRTRIFESSLSANNWTMGVLLKGEVNEIEGHVGNPVITHDGRYLLFSVCRENWQGKTTCGIYQARRINDNWKKVEKLGDGINLNGYNSTQPAVGIDEERNRYILYFVSDRPRGKGGTDIWYSQYNKLKDEWSKPRNCGSKINTVGDEETPWIDVKESTLYFSSNGHPGIGGMDIFKSYGALGRWSETEMMGVPINSPADDTYFRKQARDRYMLLTSNRRGSLSLWGGSCCDDIYEVYFPENIQGILRITAYEIEEEPSGLKNRSTLPETLIKVFYVDPTTGDKYYLKGDTAADGTIDFEITPGRIYAVEGGQPGFFTESKTIDTRKMLVNDTVNIDLELKRWDERPIVIPNIYFEFNSDELTTDSKLAIDTTILVLMLENPEIIIEIMAHTDNKGTETYNEKLSQNRANSVTNYLRNKGIERDRLSAKGYGEAQPIAPNEHPDGTDNPEGRSKNRRVEFRVIGTKMVIRRAE